MRLWAWLLQHWGTVSGDGRQPVALLPCSGVGFDLGIEGLWKRRLMLQLPESLVRPKSDRRLLQEIAATVEMICKQVQPNGGASIPDSLRRLRQSLRIAGWYSKRWFRKPASQCGNHRRTGVHLGIACVGRLC